MKAVPGTLQTGGAPFVTTHWSVIAACEGASAERSRAALTQLCLDYWPPLYSFVRRRGYSPADAQDLVQGFFAFLLKSDASGGGHSTFGAFTITHHAEVALTNGSGKGTPQFTSPNGDTLTASVVGQGIPILEPVGASYVSELYTATGGTGRFDGAIGNFTVELLIDPQAKTPARLMVTSS